MKHLYYFGCIDTVGHYMWETQGRTIYGGSEAAKNLHLPENLLRSCDGIFAPTEVRTSGLYRSSQIGICKILSWHDYSVDKRPGSNSILFAVGYDTDEEILDAATKKFPSVMNRQPRPVKFDGQ